MYSGFLTMTKFNFIACLAVVVADFRYEIKTKGRTKVRYGSAFPKPIYKTLVLKTF